MTAPSRHPRFERAAAALRENLKRRKAQARARVAGDGTKEEVEMHQPSGASRADVPSQSV